MGKLIVISGTPGTGKSTWTEILVKKLGFNRLEVHDYYKQISISYNKKKQCYDIDMKKFEKLVKSKLKEGNLIVDSHISHLLPKTLVNLCIVLTCSNLKKLEKRLQVRKYSKKKIKENLDAEVFQICLIETQEKGHKVVTFDTSKKITQKKFVNKVMKEIV